MDTPTRKQNLSVPFFARFLESQEAEPRAAATLKYPSDRDEIEPPYAAPGADNALNACGPNRATLKYPSDRDEWDPNTSR